MATLKDRINEILRENQDMSYQAFADRVNQVDVDNSAKLTKSFVADIVNGTRQPKAQTIVRIAKAFNVSTDYLLGITDIKTTANDDTNMAAKTTGLSTDCIEMLSKIAHDKETPQHIYLALEQLLSDYINHSKQLKRDKEFIDYSYLSLLGRFWYFIKHNADDDIIDFGETISLKGLNINISPQTFTREIILMIDERLGEENKSIYKYKVEIDVYQRFIDELYENSQIMNKALYERELKITAGMIAKEHEQVIKRLDFSKTPDLEKSVRDLIKKKGGHKDGKH